jgi:uncharacterized DUF497 family protein
LRFIWDYDNITHIAKHAVSPEEVEQAFEHETFPVEYQDWQTEERVAEIGITRSGRFLYIVTTVRSEGVRCVTAFDAPKRLVEAYLKQR